MSSVCIHIFRRDYRLDDNTTLLEACKTHDIVIPIFIFTSKQIDKKQNPFRSDNCLQFLCESLADLDIQLKSHKSQLYIFYDDSHSNEYDILESLIKMKGKTQHPDIKTISFNMDYTKYSKERDAKIEELCKKNNIECLIKDDICVNPIGTVLTGGNKPYTKYTPFWRASASKDIRKPSKNNYNNYLHSNSSANTLLVNKLKKHPFAITIDEVMKPEGKIMAKINDKLPEKGGRDNGLKILKGITEWKDYDEHRDLLSYKTTHLSPFNKFGCVSIREVYWIILNKLGTRGEDGLIRQLFWRDFFYNLSHYYPEIVYKEKAVNPKYRHINWSSDNASMDKFHKWCNAETGFPV
jgi:deoxyribodipyrimidine photo-lyase